MKKIFDFIKKIIRAILKFLGFIKDKPGPGKPKPPKERGFRELPDGTKLPEPYDGEEVKRLIHSVQSVSDEDERFVYDTVLVSALEGIRPLMKLYDLIPRIWAGDSSAESEFNRILSENSSGVDVQAYEQRAQRSMEVMRGEIPRPGGNGPCGPSFFLKPDALFAIQQTATLLAGDNEKRQVHSLATIDKISNNSLCPNVFNSLAHQDRISGGQRLHERIRIHAKESEYFGRVDELRGKRGEANNGYDGLTQPPADEEGPWRPPRSGLKRPAHGCGPDDGPDDGPGGDPFPDAPGFPEDCKPIRDYCRDFIRGAGRGVQRLPDSVSTGDIDSISTGQACNGGTITINGSGFGASQGNKEVVFGTTSAQVISWSDTEIVVRVPDGISGRVCIGIRDKEAEQRRKEVHEGNRRAFEEFSEGAELCLGQPDDIGTLPYRPDTPECRDINLVDVGVPSIYFRVNGGQNVTVEAGDDLVLDWAVSNADSMSIIRIGSDGPDVNITGDMVGSQNIGAFNAGSEITATYKIEASNACGTVSQTVTAKAVRTPNLSILGIEVTQPIQRFNRNNPGQNNSVRLVSEKRTMVRVYVESGVSDGFDFGEGPNILPDVTGHLTLTYPGGNTVTVNDVLNPGDDMEAQPAANVDRGTLDHSLNFELPVNNLDGNIHIEAEVYTQPGDGAGRWDLASTSADFQHNGRLRLVAVLVNDTVNNNNAPTMADYATSLQGARTRLPVREQGFLIFRAPNHRTINTQSDEDLTNGNGWSNLLDRLDDIADDYQDNGEIWTGLVPNSGAYAWNGLANDGVIPFWWDDHPRMLSRSGQGATFAHELAHTVSIDHASSVNVGSNPGVNACGNPAGVDNSLVSLTEDVGMDVAAYRLMPQSIPTLMTYCTPNISGTTNYQDRWMSIDLWNRLWNQI
ncbi:MAG: IPT/TIG domain-containing protein [Bacteroidales bacterium]